MTANRRARTRSSSRRSLVIALVAAALAVAGAVGLAYPASAHDALIASTPSAGETLTELPAEFSVTMNEAMLDLPGGEGFALQIRDAAGSYYGDGCVEVAGATMSAGAALGEPGEYTMLWQVVSEDGHPVSGEVPFSWAPAGEVEPGVGSASVGSATPPVCGEAATPTAPPSATASPPTASPEPSDAVATASGIDLATALWIAGALLAVAIAIIVAVVVARRRRATRAG